MPLSRLCFGAELSCSHLCFPVPHLRIRSLSHACLRGRNQKSRPPRKESALSFSPSLLPRGVVRGLLFPRAVLIAAPVPVCVLALLSHLLHPSLGTPRTGEEPQGMGSDPLTGQEAWRGWLRPKQSLCILSGQDLSVLEFRCPRESKRRFLGSGTSSLGGGTASSSSRSQASDVWSERPILHRPPS